MSIYLPDFSYIWDLEQHWQPNPEQVQQFQALYAAILAGNRQLNLTRITEPTEFWEKHLWDSLWGISPWLGTQNSPYAVKTVLDIGTGAGFPGVPIAIARPDWSVTLLDSTHKKVHFLQALAEQLEISTLRPLCDRAEALAHDPDHREAYDLALVRAVGTANLCAEYALPFLSLNGIAVLYRGQWTREDAIALHRALEQLGGNLESVTQCVTPISGSQRHCLYLRKTKPSPTLFPRPVGIPSQKPL